MTFLVFLLDQTNKLAVRNLWIHMELLVILNLLNKLKRTIYNLGNKVPCKKRMIISTKSYLEWTRI